MLDSRHEISPRGYTPSNSDWTSVMEFKLFPAGPISENQRRKMMKFLDTMAETSTRPHEVATDEEDVISIGVTLEASHELRAVSRAFEAAVGALASAGVDIELVELKDAAIWGTRALPSDKQTDPLAAGPLLEHIPLDVAQYDFQVEIEEQMELHGLTLT